MKILITGGLGYTGIELTKTLSEKGHEIFVVDIDLYCQASKLKKTKILH